MRRKDQLAGVIGLVVGLTCLLNVSARADIILNFAFEFDPPPTVKFTGTHCGELPPPSTKGSRFHSVLVKK